MATMQLRRLSAMALLCPVGGLQLKPSFAEQR